MNKRSIYILIFVFFIGYACKKQHRYPEDPKASTQTPKQRLIGVWQISEYTLNGNSILNPINFGGFDITTYQLKWIYNSDDKKYYTDLINEFNDETYLNFGPFQSSGDCSLVKCFITPLKCTNTLQTTNWEIKKLYGSDLHLTLQTDTGEFKLFFKKTHN